MRIQFFIVGARLDFECSSTRAVCGGFQDALCWLESLHNKSKVYVN